MSHRSRFPGVAPFRLVIVPLAALLAAACDREPPTASGDSEPVVLDELFSSSEVGLPLGFITREDRRAFVRGRNIFNIVFTPETGLGPLFNARGCAVCHAAPAVGGVGPQIETHATAFVADDCEEFDELNGGSVVQDSSTPALLAHGIDGEPMFPGTTGAGRRTTPDLFGFGLIEAIDDDEITRRADPDDRNRDGISGRVTLSAGEEEEGEGDGELHVGRFGKKGQQPSLTDFIIDALIYEQGITSADEEEQLVAGEALPDGVDPAADPELTDQQLADLVRFVQLLAPPPSVRLSRSGQAGKDIFREIGCASCHTPAMRTAGHEVAALNGRTVFLYSDLLLHDLGTDNADICVGNALPSEFRTEPLMGLRFSSTFMHDGRATTLTQAIRAHGGEGSRARAKFERLSSWQRDALLRFLRSI
jgi:CxxC motif-containing protein (DUF1111 family)